MNIQLLFKPYKKHLTQLFTRYGLNIEKKSEKKKTQILED